MNKPLTSSVLKSFKNNKENFLLSHHFSNIHQPLSSMVKSRNKYLNDYFSS